MRACWIDAGNDPDYAKLAKYGIDTPYFDPRDPRVTASYLDSVKAHPGIATCGLYFASNWGDWTGPGFAEDVDKVLRRIGWRGNPPVCLDIETHDITGYVLPCLQRWRQLRPTRRTWWTLEGFQGGLLTPPAVALLAAGDIRIAPQFYAGDMTPLTHSPVIDLLMAGVDGTRIDGMYDAAHLPYSWRGFAFTQGRLP